MIISPVFQVWLADNSLLVLKGGGTPDWESFDNPWQPIDDFQAPYRQPVLPPPDFDPDTLDIGVGVPIETIVEQRRREKKMRAKKQQISGAGASVRETETVDRSEEEVKPEVKHVEVYSTNNINDIPAVLAPENKLKPFKEEVDRSQQEFRQFLDDVSKFISDMENFHSVKQSASQSLPRSVPTPTPTSTPTPTPTPTPRTTPTPTRASPSPRPALISVTPRSLAWRSNISDPSPFPVSYVSPYAKVYLSTKYISNVASSTPSPHPHRPQARSTRQPETSTTTVSPARVVTLSAIYRERSSTTPSTTPSTTTSTTTSTTSPPTPGTPGVIFHNYHNDDQEDWQPVTTPKPIARNFNREEEFKSVSKSHHHHNSNNNNNNNNPPASLSLPLKRPGEFYFSGQLCLTKAVTMQGRTN